MLNNLRKALSEETTSYCEKMFNYITENENMLESESTKTRWNNYQNGKATKEETINFAKKRIEKAAEKEYNKKLSMIEKAEQLETEKIKSITIYTEWKRSSVWGYNPHTTVDILTDERMYHYYGSASGCGYDKYSAAVADALHQCNLLRFELFKLKDEYMQNNKKLPYGSGYGALPYMEGGCGICTIEEILKALNYKQVAAHSTDKTDYLYFEKGVN